MADILVFVEHNRGIFRKNTLSSVAAAKVLSGLTGGAVDALVIGDGVSTVADAVSRCGVRKVLLVEGSGFANYLAATFAPVVATVATDEGYGAIFASASTTGKDLMPRLSGLLDAPLATDVVGLEVHEGAIRAKRPMYAGNAIATVAMEGSPLLFTVRQTAFSPAMMTDVAAVIEKVAAPAAGANTTFLSRQETQSARPELTEARVVVSAGRGIKAGENFEMVEKLADQLKGAIGASRAAVDAGWAPNDWQVGQTGKIVAPDLYIALGISGAIQHIAGMKDSKVIVAINKDEEAPIFQVADYGLVGDIFTVVPELLAELRK